MTTTQTLNEDDIYRTSTQYRLWSFSPETLAAVRRKTRDLAIKRARVYGTSTSKGTQGVASNGDQVIHQNGHDIDFLTEREELWLVQRYCEQIRTTSDHSKWPINVKATAVQYLKRFYTSNSCITYPPKEIYKTVLFLACKTEATHMKLSDYARRISTEKDVILAPEYKVMQALRFTLEVRQPYRGLKGVLMELLNMVAGVGDAEAGDIVKQLTELEAPPEGNTTPWLPPTSDQTQAKHLNDRVQAAYAAARAVLDRPALLTDVYFLYTPSQILLAALQLADEPLTAFYLSTKMAPASGTRPKILATVRACAEMLASFSESDVMSKDERAELEAKLERCRDPATKDLVKSHAAAKRGDSEEEAEKAKKRKVEREKNMREGDDLFGPGLSGDKG